MPKVIGVRFRTSPKVYYFDPGESAELRSGDFVIVETTRGQEAGMISFPPREVPEQDIPGPLKPILRPATAVDLTDMERYQQREKQALRTCREQVAEFDLSMKLIRAEYNFNGTHLTFYFTAEKRVDFRTLVKSLAHLFKARIELRQIGVRDEVRLLGGYGLCGRPHCCASWMSDFRPISIRMAKQQDLPLSPMEISGVCGRLLCCLSYETEYYAQVKQRLPHIGETISTPQGEGQVTAVNVIKETVTVLLPDEVILTVNPERSDDSTEESDRQADSGKRRHKR